MPANFFNKLGNMLKGKKPEAEATPAAQAPAAEPETKPSLATITGSEITAALNTANVTGQSLRDTLDTISARLIAAAREPEVSTGQVLQQLRRQLAVDAEPFMDYDDALTAAVEQLEHYCTHADVETRNKIMGWLSEAFAARTNVTPTSKRDVLVLKRHYQRAQLIAQQGQLLNSSSRIAEYQALLNQYEGNPALDPMGTHRSYIKQMLEHIQKMEKSLMSNIGTLKEGIQITTDEINTAPMTAINPAEVLASVVEIINADREAYKSYLRGLSSYQKMIEMINNGANEITVLEYATEQQIRESQLRIEAETVMRQKREALARAMAASPVAPVAPVVAEPVINTPAPSVVEVEPAEVPAAKPNIFI